jgi:glycerol-1-phosphate dehydrogenase [NAD(P)+]
MDPDTLARARDPDLRVGRGILASHLEGLSGSFALVSQPEPLAMLDTGLVGRASTVVEATSLEETLLKGLLADVASSDAIVGVGGGVTMDTAKYLAWRTGWPLILVPSIISVDASVTNSIAIRRAGKVAYEGFVVADPIIADLDLVARAPPRFNRAGVGDLLSIHTARHDWALGARAGRITFDDGVDTGAAEVLASLYAVVDEVAAVTDGALEHLIRAYVRVNALCLDAGHSGPEEGSEHYFAYAAEAMTGRSFVHGEIVSLGVVLMASLQGNDPGRAADFLDRCAVGWRPHRQGLDGRTVEAILAALPQFVREAGLRYSVIDETHFDAATIAAAIANVQPAAA